MKLQRQIISFLQNFRPRFRVGLWKLALFLIAAPALVIPTLIYLKLLRIPPLGYYSGMAAQPIPEPQGIIHLQDGSVFMARRPVPGTVPTLMETYPYASAPDAAGRELGNPLPATLSNMQRGEVVFGTFCQPCHGYRGVGDGSAVGPGRLPAPPTLHSQKVRAWSDGRIYHNIMMGQNLMPSYAKQIEPVDRWAAILYLRALQRALAPKPGDLPSTGSAPARAAASGQAQPERGTAK